MKCPYCNVEIDMEETSREEKAAEKRLQFIREGSYLIDPEAFVSYSGKSRAFKNHIDFRRAKAREQARREYEEGL